MESWFDDWIAGSGPGEDNDLTPEGVDPSRNMNTANRNSRLAFLTLLLLTLGASANAYVDPGTGSLFTQVLIAGTLGVLFALKSFWGNLRTSLVRLVARHGTRAAGHGD